MMKIWLNLMARPQSKGFTLLELLIASIMSFFVISATGFAILIMTRQSLVTDISSDLTFNTSRAADFIADEVKQSSFISTATVPACTLGGNDQLVFSLAIASTQANVVYYSKTPPPSSPPWRGPSSIYRCGPSLNGDGSLNPSSTVANILLDSVSTSTAATTTPACPLGTTKRPTTPTAGFFLCVNNTNPNLVQMRITTTSSRDDLGVGRSGSSSGNYTVTTNMFTRASAAGSASLTRSSAAGTCNSLTLSIDGRAAIPFSSGMGVVATRSSTITGWTKTVNSPSASQDTFVNGACTIIASF